MRMATRDDNPLQDSHAVKATAAPFLMPDALGSEEGTAPPPRLTSASTPSTQLEASPSERGELKCPLCSSQFTRRQSLERHIEDHPGETDYVCPAQGCGKRFSTTGNLARHRRRHGYIPPIKCPADRCKYSTNAAHKLARHVKIHRETPTRACEHPGCGKTFATTGNLNRHIRTQHLRPQGARPGRPRGSSVARPPDTSLVLDASPDVVGGHNVSGSTGSAAPVDASAVAVRRRESDSRETKDDELLNTLSLFLDDELSQPDVGTPRDVEENHEGFECSQLLDELAKFHAAHSPV